MDTLEWLFLVKNQLDQTLIAQQFGISVEGAVDVANALVKEAQVALKNIVSPDAFINEEQWNVIYMKEKYHAKFITIL